MGGALHIFSMNMMVYIELHRFHRHSGSGLRKVSNDTLHLQLHDNLHLHQITLHSITRSGVLSAGVAKRSNIQRDDRSDRQADGECN